MMNFLDLSAASEEECRLIREILSDTSVVNIADPIESKLSTTISTSTTQLAAPKQTSNVSVRPNLSQQDQATNQILFNKQGQNSSKPQQSSRQLNNFAPKSDYANQSINSSSSSSAKAQPETGSAKSHLESQKSPIIASQQSNNISSLHHNLSDKSTSSSQNLSHPNSLSIDSSNSPDHPVSTSLKTPSTTNATHNDNTEHSLNGLKASPNADENTNNVDPQTSNFNVNSEQLLDQHHQPSYSVQQHSLYGQKQAFRNNLSTNDIGQGNYSNASNHGHTNHIIPVTQTTQNYRSNYNGQRKSSHNSGNINNNSRNRIPSMSNVSSGSSPNNTNVQPIYPQQFTPPLPSNVIPSNPYHNINVNSINSHNPAAINNQLSHQRASEHGSDRLRNHMHNNNNINIVSTSSSVMPNIGINLDHHGNTIPINMYNQHATHLHHQVPPVMSAPKMDSKNNGSKNSGYHVQETQNNLQTASSGGQPSTSSGQMPQMAGDMNTVIGMDMTSHPQGYAIQAFAPPHPHQMFSGPPIFQPHPHYSHYLIPYNLPSYVPYVPIPPNTVPPQPQVQPQTSQTSSSVATTTSHSRQNHSMNQQLHNDRYDSGLVGNRTSNPQQPRLENSQPVHNRTLAQTSNACDAGHIGNPKMVQGTNTGSMSPRSTTEDQNSLDNTSLGSHNQAAPLQERPYKVPQNTKSANPMKTSPPASKSKDIIATKVDKVDHQGSKLSQDAYLPTSNGQSTSEITQQDDAKNALPAPTSNASDDIRAPISIVDAPTHPQSSPEVAHSAHESSNKSTNHVTKKPQSEEGCSKSSSDQVPSDSQDSRNTEAGPKSAGQSASSKSWADLFKRREGHRAHSNEAENENCTQWAENSDEESKAQKSSKKDELISKSSSTASTKEQRSQDSAKRALDKMAHRVAVKVDTINLKHALPFLKPRGFINKGNGCYINATLQALIACPPFYNLMKEIGDLRAFRRENSCTPILDSFAELFLHFPPLDSGKKVKQAGSSEPRSGINSLQAEAIEPKCIYNVLGNIKSECLRGAQEDAEEFLSSVLNGLHEEMISLREVLHESNGQTNQQSDVEDSNDDNTNDDNLWREVGSKNRSLPIRIAKVVNTPIQEIFGGSLFSIRTAGKDRCGHRSPFFDLQLDISGDNVKSVQDAIKSFTSPEIIHDFYCSKTKQKLDAQRKTSLDQLPPILILHLKQFIYTQDCGLKKLMKKIEYPIDFELPESCLHEKNSADKNLLTSRSYKLLAVVYHDGKEAVKGHYLTDVYHIGSSQWIRCDDSNLKPIPSPRIDNPDAPRTPYLLFYRRLNTIRAQTNNHDNKKKN